MADDDIKKLGSAVEQFAAAQKEQAIMEKGGFAAFAKSEAVIQKRAETNRKKELNRQKKVEANRIKAENDAKVAAYEARQESKKGFDKVIDATKESNDKLESVKKVQELLKDEQKEVVKTEKKLLDLETNKTDISATEYEEQKKTLNDQLDQSKLVTARLDEQLENDKEELDVRQKQVLKLEEQKTELQEFKEQLESQGEDAEKNKEFRKRSLEIQEKELDLRLKTPGLSPSQQIEIEKERAQAQLKQGTLIQKGFAGMKLGLMGLTEKFGAGAMTIGKTLLTLFGIGLLIKFLQSDTWKRIRDFLGSPSWKSFKEIFAPGGSFDGISIAIGGVIAALVVGLAGLTFKMLGGPLLIKAIKGVFSLAAAGIGKMLPKKTMGPSGEMVSVDGDGKDKTKDKGKVKKQGRLGRLFGAVKNVGGTALEKGAQAARAVGQSAKAVGSKAVSLGKTGLEKGTQLAKQTVQVGTQIGKDAVTGAKAAIPKIAGAGKAGLKAAAAAGKFIPGAGLIIGASVAAVEGVVSGVEEFKESGDAGRAIAEGFGGAISSLTFGAVDKEKFADFFKKEEALSSDQLAQAMAGGPSVGPAQFASLAGGSDAARLRELENELKGGGMTDRMRQNRLSQMKSLEAKMARGNGSGGNNVNVVNQDNSVRSNATNNTHTSTPIVDRDLDFLATASP